MRIFHFAIIFAIIAIIFITIRDISYAQQKTATYERQQLDQEFHKAVDHAVETLILDEKGHIITSCEEAITAFFDSLYASFDFFLDPEGKQSLQFYIPVIAIVDEDGLYFNYLKEVKNETTQLVRTWTERIPYQYQENDVTYEFSLSKAASCYDKDHNLQEVIETVGDLELIRMETIQRTIEENLITFMNVHNHIAQQYGIVYDFILPAYDNSFFSRTIEEPTMLVLFQGYPIKGSDEVYNCAAFGGASLIKKDWYILSEKDGYYLYHNQDCEVFQQYQEEHPAKEQIICSSKKECASFGAFPCANCFPSGKNYDFLGYIQMKN